MKTNPLLLFVPWLFALLAACNMPGPASPSGGPDLDRIVSQTQTAMAPVVPQNGQDPATQMADTLACPEPDQAAPIPWDQPFEALPGLVEDYLNAGGSPAELNAQLEAMGLAMPPAGTATGDFDGDGRRDVTVALIDSQAGLVNPSGMLIVFLCRQGAYAPLETRRAPEGFGGPHVLHSRDLNADGMADLVIGYDSCGAHTCFSEAEILAWNGSSLENRLEWSLQGGLPGMRTEVVDPQGDGTYDLMLTAAGIGSVGAGPQREETWIFTFDPAVRAWTLADQMRAAAFYRVHALHDADQLLLEGQFQPALELYGEVIDSPDLQAWGDPQLERPFLSGYGRFKRVVVRILQGDLQAAQSEYERLGQDFPPESSGHPWARLGDAFWQAFSANGDLAQGCAAARQHAEEHPAEILEPFDFGYANPQYTAVEICPW